MSTASSLSTGSSSRFMMRVEGGRVPGQASLSNHIKEWLRPIQPKHGRTKLVTVIKALEYNMHKHTGLDWQPLGHLVQAANSLEESQRVAMYAQVFAFYLGCVPKYYPASTLPSRGPLEPDQSGFRRRLFPDNDPRALDAIMFYNCLEQLEVDLTLFGLAYFGVSGIWGGGGAHLEMTCLGVVYHVRKDS